MRRKIVLTGIMAVAILILGACGDKRESQPTDSSGIQDKVSSEETPAPENSEISEQSNSVSEDMLTGTYPDGSTPTYSGEKLKLTVDGEEIIIAMYDNTAV